MKQAAPPSIPGVSHRDVGVDGVRLHVAEAGDGPPMVLVHGWPQHWWCWRHLIPRPARSYRVLAPDLRGLGWSDAPPGDHAKSSFAADLLALLDAEGLDRVRLIGHDWGQLLLATPQLGSRTLIGGAGASARSSVPAADRRWHGATRPRCLRASPETARA